VLRFKTLRAREAQALVKASLEADKKGERVKRRRRRPKLFSEEEEEEEDTPADIEAADEDTLNELWLNQLWLWLMRWACCVPVWPLDLQYSS
jgi:hypothetical protein